MNISGPKSYKRAIDSIWCILISFIFEDRVGRVRHQSKCASPAYARRYHCIRHTIYLCGRQFLSLVFAKHSSVTSCMLCFLKVLAAGLLLSFSGSHYVSAESTTIVHNSIRASSFANLSTAVISRQTQNKTIVIDDEQHCADLYVPADRGISVVAGGRISVAAGKTLRIDGRFSATFTQIFIGSGAVRFGPESVTAVYPQWWGRDTAAIQQAIDSFNTVYFTGEYFVDRTIHGRSQLSLRGQPSAKIYYTYQQLDSDPADRISLFVFPDGVSNVDVSCLELVYLGTFDTGSSYSGKINGLFFQGVNNLLISDVDIHGFNHSGIKLLRGESWSAQVTIAKSKLHNNRVAGIWFAKADGLSIVHNDLFENGSATDPGTGYGCAGSYGHLFEHAKNVRIYDNRVYYNKRVGIDLHTGENVVIENNNIYGSTETSPSIGDMIDGIYLGEIYGDIRVINNIIRSFRDHGEKSSYACYAVKIGYPWPGTRLNQARVTIEISGNLIHDFDVAGGMQRGYIIGFIDNDFAHLKVTVADNIIDAGTIFSFINANSSGGSAEHNAWNITRNIFMGKQLLYVPFALTQITDVSMSNNAICINASSHNNKSVVVLKATDDLRHPRVLIVGNTVRAPEDDWKLYYENYAAEKRDNYVNNRHDR